MKTETEIKAEIERVKEYIENEGILWNVAQFQSRIAVLEWTLADSAPAPAPTDEEIVEAMTREACRAAGHNPDYDKGTGFPKWKHVATEFRYALVLDAAKPLIRQQMESRHE